MPTEEERELLAQIERLEGRIHRHKAQNAHPTPQTNHFASPRGASYRTAPYASRGGFRGRYAPTYRNRTLVLNGRCGTPGDSSAASAGESTELAEQSGNSWVSRTDRHLQLINSAVFKKDAQARTSAIEQTQRQKKLHKELLEKKRVLNYVQRNGSYLEPPNAASDPSKFEILVEGIRFQVTKQGSKLLRTSDNPTSLSTPHIASVGGVKFHRTKNGNLIRHGVARAQRMASGIKKVNIPCKAFSWTGSCSKGPRCRFVHDPSKVAICRDWLFKNDCSHGDGCDLSHDPTEQRTPLCMHFANGSCNNDSCPYVHAEHSQTDPVCRDFGLCGYCDKGAQCPDRHVFECPDFSNTGVCKTKGCKLLHKERASILRKKGKQEEEESDLSSDDDDDASVAIDDLDSDEVDEFIGKDEGDNLDFSRDFIGF